MSGASTGYNLQWTFSGLFDKSLISNLVKIVELDIWHVLRHDEHFDPRVLHEELHEALGAEGVVHQQPVLLVSPAISCKL